MNVRLEDYIEGYETLGTFDKPKKKYVKGWVKVLHKDYVTIVADDEWNGARGTSINNDDIISIIESVEDKELTLIEEIQDLVILKGKEKADDILCGIMIRESTYEGIKNELALIRKEMDK